MTKEFKSYEQRHAGKKINSYRITRRNGQHWRNELVGKSVVPVMYSGKEGGRNIIKLTEAGAKSLKHLGLVETTSGGVILPASVKPQVEIPEDWESLSAKEVKEIARQLTDDVVSTRSFAEDVITEHLAEQENGDDHSDSGGDDEDEGDED